MNTITHNPLKARNFLQTSGYISVAPDCRKKSFRALKMYATKLEKFEIIVFNVFDRSFYQWHFIKRHGRWKELK